MSKKKRPIGKMKKRQILFSVISFMMFLVLMEGGIRTYFWIKNKIDIRERNFKEYLGWETAANLSKKYSVKGYEEIKYSTKKYGFRSFGDVETDKIKILVIGDSFTAGRTVSDGETYYDYLEKYNDNIEVFAYGAGGYGSLQEFMILDRYFEEIEPDLVLWQFCGNDLINNSHALESASLTSNNHMTRPYYENGNIEWLFPEQYHGWIDKLIQSSYLLRLLNIRFNVLKAETLGSKEDEFSVENPLFRQAVEITSEIMMLVKERVGNVPIFAFFVGWPKVYREICDNNSIHVIEGVSEAIQKAKASGIVVDGSPYDRHWNSVGHSIAGETILTYLTKCGYLYKRDRSLHKDPTLHRDFFGKYRPSSNQAIRINELSLAKIDSSNSSGFGNLEGPYPQWDMPNRVRWIVAPEAAVKLRDQVETDTMYSLHVNVLSQAAPQALNVMINGATILEATIDSSNKWQSLNSKPVKLKAGENILKFRASAFKRYPESSRDLYVLFDVMEFQEE